jgi:hypothetical protein
MQPTTMAEWYKARNVFPCSNIGLVGSSPIRGIECLSEFNLFPCCLKCLKGSDDGV